MPLFKYITVYPFFCWWELRLFLIFLLQWTCCLFVHEWKSFSKEQNFQGIWICTSSAWLDSATLFSKPVVPINNPTNCIKMSHHWTPLPTVGNVRLLIFHSLMWKIMSYHFNLNVPDYKWGQVSYQVYWPFLFPFTLNSFYYLPLFYWVICLFLIDL